jgi:hypothetical protein
MMLYHARLFHGLAIAAKFIVFAVVVKILLLLVLLPLALVDNRFATRYWRSRAHRPTH